MEHNISESTSITHFDIKGKSLYVKVLWKQTPHDLFHIKIYDGNVSWSGRFSYEFAKKYSERFEENDEEYYKSAKKGLKGTCNGDFSYDFVITEEDTNSAIFSWKKRFQDSNHGLAVLVHGSVPVHRDTSNESKDTLLDFLLAENRDLRSAVTSLHDKNELIMADLQKCKSELEKFVDIKTSLETSLYGKFVQLLNAKKRRIQLLDGSLHKFASPKESMEARE